MTKSPPLPPRGRPADPLPPAVGIHLDAIVGRLKQPVNVKRPLKKLEEVK